MVTHIFCPFLSLALTLSGGYFPARSWFCFTGSQVFSSSLCSFLKPSFVQLAWQRPKAAAHNEKASSGHWVDWQIHSVKSRQKPGGELGQPHLGKLSVWWPCHLSPNMLVRFTKAIILPCSFFGNFKEIDSGSIFDSMKLRRKIYFLLHCGALE